MYEDLHKAQHQTQLDICSDDIIYSLMERKVEILKSAKVTYTIIGDKIETSYSNEVNKLLEQIDNEVKNRIQTIINLNLDKYNLL